MMHACDSPYLDCDAATLAAAMTRHALRPTPDLQDPVLTALGWEAAQFMVGACATLAAHLHGSRGMEPILLEARAPGESWGTRHAAVCRCTVDEARDLIGAWHGDAVPVLDAAGAGTFGERFGLYRETGFASRVVLARDTDAPGGWLWNPPRPGPSPFVEECVGRLPSLAHALDVPFDLREAQCHVLAEPTFRSRRGASEVLASGLPEWVAERGPVPWGA